MSLPKLPAVSRLSRAHPNYKKHKGGPLKKGDQIALASKLTPEQNHKRMIRMFSSWNHLQRNHQKETKHVPKRVRKKISDSHYARLRATAAKEAREIQTKCRTYADAAIETLLEIMNDASMQGTTRVAAASLVLDRAYGKPNQTNVNANVDANGKTKEVSGAELNARIDEALRQFEAASTGAATAPESKERPADLRKLDPDPNGSKLH